MLCCNSPGPRSTRPCGQNRRNTNGRKPGGVRMDTSRTMTADRGITSPSAVVQRFPAVSKNAQLIALGNRGGFSGARLWRVETPGEAFCLKAWPPQAPSVQRLARIHQLMHSARASGLSFVPALLQSDRGTTWTEHEGRLWDL